MRLSKNFVLSEITRSNTAKRLGISNEPTKKHLESMQRIVSNLVQPMRDQLQHCKGEALDIQFWEMGQMNNKIIYDWILESGLQFDQMINEFDYSWIHLSLKEKDNRKQVLIAYKDDDGDTAYKYAPDIHII